MGDLAVVMAISKYLGSTTLSWAVRGGMPWIWPAAETVHFIGMSLLIGIVGLLDLRMIGVAKGLPVAPLERLIPWGILGFCVCLFTGFLFFTGDPGQYNHNNVFWLKLLFITLAGLNVLAFYATGLARKADAAGAGEQVPFAARLIGATSIVLWIGVIFLGRMLPFLGGSF